jgi:protein-arginine kinase
MINEEDHIRIQAMGNDLSLTDLYNFILLCWSMVSKRIKDKLGSASCTSLITLKPACSKMKLVAKHLISKELIKQPASAVLLNDDESLSIMINDS